MLTLPQKLGGTFEKERKETMKKKLLGLAILGLVSCLCHFPQPFQGYKPSLATQEFNTKVLAQLIAIDFPHTDLCLTPKDLLFDHLIYCNCKPKSLANNKTDCLRCSDERNSLQCPSHLSRFIKREAAIQSDISAH